MKKNNFKYISRGLAAESKDSIDYGFFDKELFYTKFQILNKVFLTYVSTMCTLFLGEGVFRSRVRGVFEYRKRYLQIVHLF